MLKIKQSVIKLIFVIISIISGIIFFIIINNTDPNSITPFYLLGVFLILYLFLFSIFSLLIIFLNDIFAFITKKDRKKISYLTFLTIGIFSFIPIYIISTQSLRDVNLYELGLLLIFMLLLDFYIKKH